MSLAVARVTDVWEENHASYVGIDEQNPLKLVGAGPELEGMVRPTAAEMKDFHLPASRQKETVSEAFARLAAEWREAAAPSSSTLQMAMHPAYQRIMGMGRDAIPLILGELSREAEHWFWALEMITREDPVSEEDWGDVEKVREAWLQWGKRNGYNTSVPA